MKALLVFIIAAGFVSPVSAQTKRIAHRSHSGADHTFHWRNSVDNFGETPEMIAAEKRRKEVADSIARKAVADSIARTRNFKKTKKVKRN